MDRRQSLPSDPPTAGAAPLRLLDPRLHLALNVLLVTASELLLKRGAMATLHAPGLPWLDSLGIGTLGSGWVWAGIACYIVSFLNWLYILRWLPLSIAFPLASTVHALIPLGAWLFLGETLGPVRWGGIGLIVMGIWFIAGTLTHAEETL
jgi:drug/metabolite transporter (DMT)-like permease